jgi:hypothetical protein
MEEGRLAHVAVEEVAVGDSYEVVVLLAHGAEVRLSRVREPLLGEVQVRCDAYQKRAQVSEKSTACLLNTQLRLVTHNDEKHLNNRWDPKLETNHMGKRRNGTLALLPMPMTHEQDEIASSQAM